MQQQGSRIAAQAVKAWAGRHDRGLGLLCESSGLSRDDMVERLEWLFRNRQRSWNASKKLVTLLERLDRPTLSRAELQYLWMSARGSI